MILALTEAAAPVWHLFNKWQVRILENIVRFML